MTERRPEPGAPAPIVPIPATQVVDLRGRRAIVGEPGKGWRADLRADQPVTEQDGPVSHVPVLPEWDFYHAEIDGIEVFAPLVPIEQVWIEHLAPEPIWPGAVDPTRGRTSLTAPPVRRPSPAVDALPLTGRRVVIVADGATRGDLEDRRDLRAISEPYPDRRGGDNVNLCAERDWYAWALGGQTPRVETYPVDLVWAE